jgi:transposase
MKKEKKKPTTTKQHKTYTLDDKASAKKYYLIGLSLTEAAKLINAPVRTIEKWYFAENWKSQRETTAIKTKANDLFDSGKSYLEISNMLGKSKSTIYRYIKIARNETSY